MNTLICAGGSATRVLEAVVHLCAAGLGPERLRVLQIDPDQSNGNGSRVRGLLETYAQLHAALGGRLGPQHKLFATQIEDLGSWSPVAPGDTLAKVLRFDVLDKSAQDVARLLFTESERELTLDQGFRGHTPIGAAAMTLVARDRHREPWDDLVGRLRQDLDGPGARVFLAASVFGGTGASAIHPIARFLRSVPERNESQLKIGVAALVPYFRFKSSAGARVDLAARSEDFALATKAAVQYYQHLRENQDWDFDAMYWIGDSGVREVPYAPGGPEQRNPAHHVDLLGALATLEFYLQPQGGRACYWSGPRRDVEPTLEENLLDWPDLPLRHLDRKSVKRALWRLCLCGAAHAGFFQELLRDGELQRRPHMVPWYYRFFRAGRDGRDGQGSLASGKERETIERLGEFFSAYHLPFWGQIADSRQARLFNREAMPQAPGSERRRVDLARLHNLLWPDQGAPGDLDAMDDFFNEMIEAGRPRGAGGAAAYLSLLASAAEGFMKRGGRLAMADRFFLNSLSRKNRRLPAPAPGTWATDAPKGDFLGHFAADILVEGQVQDPRAVSSVPSVFARPIQFLQALASKEHPLHDALVRQWRGLLAVFALSDYLGLPVTTTAFEVPKKADEDDAAAGLVTILRAQLPRPPEDWERFWLLRCDGQLIGATSPWTVVYTPADYRCPASIPWRDGDGLLGDPLDHYRKVGGLQVELTLLCHYVDQVLEDRWGFERRLDDKAAAIKRELTAFRKELEKLREAHLPARGLGAPKIDVWPYRSFLRAVQAEAEQAAPQSTLLLAAGRPMGGQAGKGEGDGEAVLLLPRAGLQPTRRVYQSILYQDLDLGRMPQEGKAGWQTPAGRAVPLSYIVPEEVLLPRRLVELTLSERALSRGGVEIALPLTPAFLRFFRYEDLKAQPDLLSVTTDRQDIVVRLRLPVFGEAPLTVERRYRRGIDTARVPTPVLALWPDFYSLDFTGNLALSCSGEGDLSVRPLLDGGVTLEASGAGPGQRLWGSKAPPIGFALYLKDAPAGVVLRESLPAPEKVRGDRAWTVSVDFGTSNTHVLVDDGQAPPAPLQMKGRTVCLTEAREELREGLRSFYPQTAPKLPLVTLLVRNQATLLGERSDERYTPLFTFYPDLLTSQGTVKNVKWGGGTGGTDAESPLRAYLLGLLRYIAAEARARGVSEVQYRWSYPLALPEGARGAMAGFWASVETFSAGSTGGTGSTSGAGSPAVRVLPSASASESEAACRYLSQPKLGILPVGSSALSIVVDVGGGSSDIGFWTRGRLLEQLSFYLAANHLTEEIVRFEGLAHTLFRICSGQIDSTYEAVRPAFESQPTIMFNAVVSQARGWSGGDPQEHPVVKELFGGTLAPHGGPPWVFARGLIYLLFTGLSYYCGVHARRLLAAEEPAARGPLSGLPGAARDERRFFLYFGGRGSSLLSWLSRSGEGLGRLLGAAFREGLGAEGPLPSAGSLEAFDAARCRVEVMGPPIDYREKAPPKEEVAGGLLCPPTVSSGGGEARPPRPGDAPRPPERPDGRHGDLLVRRFLDKVVGATAPGGPLQELNLDLRPEALQVDPDKVQHRIHHATVRHPVFIHELEVLLQAYLEASQGRRSR